MIKKNLLLLLLITSCYFSFSQQQTNFWYFGTLAGLDFNTGTPVVMTNGALNTAEGCSTISDVSGNLLFYTDGVQVWNKTHTQMPNGSGLMGDASTSQSALIVPKPGSSNLYYIFTLPAEGGGAGFRYSIVDMTLQSGNGDVTTKNTFIKNNVTEKMSAVHHCNGTDIWVTVHENGTNGYFSYLITNAGIDPPVISNVGAIHTDVHGQMKFNTSGTKIASAIDTVITATPLPGTGKGFIDVCDFDKSSGVVSSPYRITFNFQRVYGLEFSPDDSKLYAGYYNVAANSGVSQFDLTASNIQSSEVVLTTSFNPDIYALQLGPDYKIYVTKEVTPFLEVITSPNTSGIACNYVSNAINLDPNSMGVMCMLGLPGCIQSYLNPNFPSIPCVVPVTANFVNSDTILCTGDCINFTDLSTGTATTWNWSFQAATPSVSSVQSPTMVCYPSAGIYTVQLIASNSSTSDTMVKTITVVAPNINAGSDVTINAGESIQLNATGSVNSYTWSPILGLSDPNISNPIATPSVTTTYMVSGTDNNNCTANDAVTVILRVPEIPCGDIFVPTGFSPNKDGENDIECVMGNCVVEMKFAIYDRWGEKVFETTDQLQCWDGTYKGMLMNTGIYVYYLNATLQNGEVVEQKGNINLIR